MGQLILVIGGARSGKSRFAGRLAAKLGRKRVTFVATARALDGEMRNRVRDHRRTRPREWKTLEAPFGLAAKLNGSSSKNLLLIDCLTFYIANRLMKDFRRCRTESSRRRLEARTISEVRQLTRRLSRRKSPSIIVTNELGMGVVPANRLTRSYRDLIGQANQIVADAAKEVHYVVAGIARQIK